MLASTSSTRLLKLDFESAVANAEDELCIARSAACLVDGFNQDKPWLRVDGAVGLRDKPPGGMYVD